MDAPIKVIKNALSLEQMEEVVSYIDQMESSNQGVFALDQDGKRVSLEIGTEKHRDPRAHWDMGVISQKRELISTLIELVQSEIAKNFDEPNPTYVASLWLAKQYPGAVIPYHDDTDDGHNTHFKYSAILYLGGTGSVSPLSFPDEDFSYGPEPGDLVMFLTQGSGRHGVMDIDGTRYSIPMWMSTDESMGLHWGDEK